jgi:hypothetical protein
MNAAIRAFASGSRALSKNSSSSPRHRSVDVAVLLRERGGVIEAPEDDFEGTPASHEAGQSLRSASTGDDPDRDLGLPEDGCLDVGEAHVAREHQLAASSPAAPRDLGDGDLGHGAEPVDHRVKQPELPGWRRRRFRQIEDEIHVGATPDSTRMRRHSYPV